MAGVPDISSLYSSPDITQAQQQSQQAQQTATNYQSAASLLPAQLKQAIEEKLNFNSDIISQQAKAQANYFAAPATARSDYQDIFNPFDREKLVAQAVSNAYAPYASLTNILGQRQGNINDIVGAGVGAFNSQVTAQQGNAQLAQNNLQSLLGQADRMASAKEWQYQAGLPTGGAGSSGPGSMNDAMASITNDAKRGVTFTDLLKKYGGSVPQWDIQNAYNQANYYKKPAGENQDTINKLLQGVPGASNYKKPSATTLTSKSTTVKGKVQATGAWTLKLSNGQTVQVQKDPGYPGMMLTGWGKQASKTTGDAQQIYNDWKSAGLDDNALVQALKNAGFILQ